MADSDEHPHRDAVAGVVAADESSARTTTPAVFGGVLQAVAEAPSPRPRRVCA